MSLLSGFVETVLKLSGIACSICSTCFVASSFKTGTRNELLMKQASGFLTLFLISLLILMVT
ncbi:MAG: hypothetical protein ABSD68_02910 [Candidatus Micrarchaeales archaeon]|jgi:hypothetical protein